MRDSYRLEIAFDVSNVPAPAATRVASRYVDHVPIQTLLVKDTIADDPEALDICTLFKDARRGRRHRSRQDSANVSMMAPRGREEDDLLALGIKDGRDYRDIGEMTWSSRHVFGYSFIRKRTHEPPAYGEFVIKTSPGLRVFPWSFI